MKLQAAALGSLLILLAGCSVGTAEEKTEAVSTTPSSPSDVVKAAQKFADVNRDVIVLAVDKTHLQAELKTLPEDMEKSNTLMTFRIAIGKEEGDKQSEGDNRTPEGIYFSQNMIDDAKLPEKYGPKAIPINFPNPYDQMLGKTGHGIWLHGVEADQRVEQAKVTEGCVAFYNADIQMLSRWLTPFQSIVVIANDSTEVNRPQDVKDVRDATMDWLHGWENRDVKQYIAHYGTGFLFENKDIKRYEQHKERIFKSYRKMTLKTDNLRIITHPKYAMAIMNQDFNGDDRYISKGRKILYWQRNDQGQWRIAREVFENRRIELFSFTADEIAKLSENSPSLTKVVPHGSVSKAPNL